MLPLGEQPGGRAGRRPADDARAHPLAGRVVEGVTGERVCVRRELDLGAVRDSLQARACAAAPLSAWLPFMLHAVLAGWPMRILLNI